MTNKNFYFLPTDEYDDSLIANLTIKTKNGIKKLNEHRPFKRGADETDELIFPISTDDLISLDNQPLSSISISISGKFIAQFGQSDYQLTADFLNSKLFDALSKVTTSSSGQNILFIPLGSNGQETSTIVNRTVELLNIQIISFKKANNDLQPEIVKSFIEKALNKIYSQVNLSAVADDATIIVFGLDNGINLQTTIGKIKSLKATCLIYRRKT